MSLHITVCSAQLDQFASIRSAEVNWNGLNRNRGWERVNSMCTQLNMSCIVLELGLQMKVMDFVATTTQIN